MNKTKYFVLFLIIILAACGNFFSIAAQDNFDIECYDDYCADDFTDIYTDEAFDPDDFDDIDFNEEQKQDHSHTGVCNEKYYFIDENGNEISECLEYARVPEEKKHVVIEISGIQDYAYYDKKEHAVEGYTIKSISDDGYTKEDFTFNGNISITASAAGLYRMGLSHEMFQNNNPLFDAEFVIVEDGWLYIIPPDAIITINGNTENVDYDGQSHSVEGYTASIQICETESIYETETGEILCDGYELYDKDTNALIQCGEYSLMPFVPGAQQCLLYLPEDLTLLAQAYAGSEDSGITYMGLNEQSFQNLNTNFGNIVFIVNDGWIEIINENADIQSKEEITDIGNSIETDTLEISIDENIADVDIPIQISEEIEADNSVEANDNNQSNEPFVDDENLEENQLSSQEEKNGFDEPDFIITSSAGASLTEGDIVTLSVLMSESFQTSIEQYSEVLFVWEAEVKPDVWEEVFRSSENTYSFVVSEASINRNIRIRILVKSSVNN